MYAAVPRLLRLILLLHLLCLELQSCIGGTCWTAMIRNDRCTELLSENTTKEECCAARGSATAWSDEQLDSGTLFFWRVLGGGVECKPCKDTCTGVTCGMDKICELRRGRPKCICSPTCNIKNHHGNSAVCGTDGRTYKNVCRLKKRACRRRSNSLTIAYHGICQSSCDKIICSSGKHCLLDQNLSPHCVKCSKNCPAAPWRRQVCGTDGQTYSSICHLRNRACRKGKAIPLAYKGACKHSASCSNIRCKDTQNCLIEQSMGTPRCVMCTHRCKPRHMNGPICGSDNKTYPSWCHMIQAACRTGYVIETNHSGKCADTPLDYS